METELERDRPLAFMDRYGDGVREELKEEEGSDSLANELADLELGSQKSMIEDGKICFICHNSPDYHKTFTPQNIE